MSITERIVSIALAEWAYFGKQEVDLNGGVLRQGRAETDEGYWQRVGVYWRDGPGKSLTGLDDDHPWSAAFISYVMRMAGAGERFRYAARHAVYIRLAVRAREAGAKKAGFWGYRLEEAKPAVGDLVCYAREPFISYDTQTDRYKSHADIVVAANATEIQVIGGNVGNSVTLKHLALDANGRLADTSRAWFAVLVNRLDLPTA